MKFGDFGLYDLNRYINAWKEMREADEIYEMGREEIISACYPSYNVDYVGDMTPIKKSVEDAAIELEALERNYKSLLNHYKEKGEILRRAISHLADDEAHVFRRKYIEGKELKQDGYLLLEKAFYKVAKFIQDQRQEHIEQQAELSRKAKAFKQPQLQNTAI